MQIHLHTHTHTHHFNSQVILGYSFTACHFHLFRICASSEDKSKHFVSLLTTSHQMILGCLCWLTLHSPITICNLYTVYWVLCVFIDSNVHITVFNQRLESLKLLSYSSKSPTYKWTQLILWMVNCTVLKVSTVSKRIYTWCLKSY